MLTLAPRYSDFKENIYKHFGLLFFSQRIEGLTNKLLPLNFWKLRLQTGF